MAEAGRASKRARTDEGSGAESESLGESDSDTGDESEAEQAEVVIDDALLAQDAGFDLRSWAGALPWGAESAQMGHLGRLAEAAFTASGGQSFWVPMERRQAAAGVLEAFAAAVFDFHTAGGVDGVEIDPARSGAEVWVQVRSATAAAAAASEAEAAEGGEEDPASINWHFDKDEDLLDECDVYLHPFISTVTYLTNVGAPTVVVVDAKITPDGVLQQAEEGAEGGSAEEEWGAAVSYPVVGKHIAFNGRLLHGCPSCAAPPPAAGQPAGPRISLLVNVWLNHVPVGLAELHEHEAELTAQAADAVAALSGATLWAAPTAQDVGALGTDSPLASVATDASGFPVGVRPSRNRTMHKRALMPLACWSFARTFAQLCAHAAGVLVRRGWGSGCGWVCLSPRCVRLRLAERTACARGRPRRSSMRPRATTRTRHQKRATADCMLEIYVFSLSTSRPLHRAPAAAAPSPPAPPSPPAAPPTRSSRPPACSPPRCT